MRKILLVIAIVALVGGAVSAQNSITTTYVSNNGGSATWLNMFDLKVLNTSGIRITSLAINTSATVNSNCIIFVHTAPLTYVGKELVSSLWTLKVSGGAGASVGIDKPTPIVLAKPLVLNAGTHAICIEFKNIGMRYTNGTGTGPTGNQVYKNADVELTAGCSVSGYFTGSIFTPRVWNGTIWYTPNVTALLTGSGAKAKIGSTYNFALLNASEPKANYGMGTSLGNGPIPIDARKLGLSLDSLLLASTSGLLPSVFANYSGALDTAGRASASLVIPNLAALKGVKVYTAFVTAKATAPSGISSISNTVDVEFE